MKNKTYSEPSASFDGDDTWTDIERLEFEAQTPIDRRDAGEAERPRAEPAGIARRTP